MAPKTKKFLWGPIFGKRKRFNLWMAISWECIIVRSSNLQDFNFIGHGSQSQIFREIGRVTMGPLGDLTWSDSS